MVWGCFSSSGVGDLTRIHCILKKEGYIDILKNNATPSELHFIGKAFVLQQDDRKHNAIVCKEYIEKKERKSLLQIKIWLPQFPGLNPIQLL